MALSGGLLGLGLGPAAAQSAGCSSTYTASGTTAGSTAGLYGEYYQGAFQLQSGFVETAATSFFATNAPLTARTDAAVNFANQTFGSTGATLNSSGNPVSFSARYRGSVYLKAGGTYTFALTADDGAYLFLGKEATLAAPTPNNAFIKNGITHTVKTVSGSVAVASNGFYDLQLIYGQDTNTSTLKLEYAGGPDNLPQQVVPQTVLCAGPSGETYAANLAPSAFRLTNGTLYASALSTALSPGVSGYDLDGTVASYRITSLPTAGALRYNNVVISSVPFVVASPASLSYTSALGVTGTYSFQYQAVDNLGQASADATYTLVVQSAAADLATTLSAPATAPQGSLVYYTATTTNAGPAVPSNHIVRIFLPAGLTEVSLSNSGTYNALTGEATFSVNAVGIAVGGFITRSIAFAMPGTAVNATATAATSSFPDLNPANNTGAAYTGPTQNADIKVTVTGPTQVPTNLSIAYAVAATNLGGSTATGVSLQAQLPAGLSGVVLSNGGGYNASTGLATWPAVASLAKGSSVARTVRFGAGAATGTITATGSATSTTADGDPVPTNNDGSNGAAQISTQVVLSTATLLCATPGQDGNATLTTASAVNTYFPGQGTVSAGATTLALGPALGSGAATAIAAGDLLVVMQMQGADIDGTNTGAYGDGVAGDEPAAGYLLGAAFTAGIYEYVVASGPVPLGGGSLTITAPLMYGYRSASATATSGQRRYQVIRVPQYNNVTLAGNLTAPRWNGLSGGVLVIDANGTFDFAGFKIDMLGRGFRGGAGQRLVGAVGTLATDYRTSTARTSSANKGEGIAGTPRYVNDVDNFADYLAGRTTVVALDTRTSGLLPAALTDGYPNGDRGRGAPANAGGGGTDGNPTANDQNTGGGGGGNAGTGGRGGNAWNSNEPMGGHGGASFTPATASRLIMGGGGGAGTNNDGTVAAATTFPANTNVPTGTGFSSSGAAGGGIVLLRAANVSAGLGTIDVSGADMSYVPTYDGSGGGGAGGAAVLLCNASNGNASSAVLQNITVLANGGRGGSNTGAGSPHGPGGGGGGGSVFASSRLNSASSLVPGPNGTTTNAVAYGAGIGTTVLSQAQEGITRTDVPNQLVSCPADVITTLSSSAAMAAPGTPVTFTITSTNAGPNSASSVSQSILLMPNLATVIVPANASYDAATGRITFATLPLMASGQVVTNTIRFAMPTYTVLGQAVSTSAGDLDARTTNNDGSAPSAMARVTASGDIAGRVFDDVNYGGGRGRDFATADASAVASGFSSGAIGSPNTTVELYNNSGGLAQTTTTGPDGYYSFSGVAAGSYTVRAVSATVQSARRLAAAGAVPVLTFRAAAGQAATDRVGGEAPEKRDAEVNAGAQTLAALTTATTTAQAVASLTLTGTPVMDVDFGFNFSTIVNTNDAGQGSLRQFIINANALPNLKLQQDASSNSGGARPAAGVETSIFMIPDGAPHQGQRGGLSNQLTSGVALIAPNTATTGGLPTFTDGSTSLDGTTQTLNIGNTNNVTLGAGGTVGTDAGRLSQLNGPEVALVGTPGQANSTYGLTLAAVGCTVRGLAIYGFGNTAANLTGADIYVTGGATSGTAIVGNVLGATATSFADPGAGTRSTGNGLYFNGIASNFVSAAVTNNLIGFHAVHGIENAASATPTSLVIQDNEIRSNGWGNAATAGLHLSGYGGTVRANLVADNLGAGVDAQGTTGNIVLADNTVSGNGMSAGLTPGVRLAGAANLVQHNVVSGNYGAGIMATAATSNNVITQNSVFDNGMRVSTQVGVATSQLGIDLLSATDNAQTGTPNYVSLNDDNDLDTGANGLLNFPVLTQATAASTAGGILTLTGFAPAGAVVELFVSDRTTAAFGQGKTYLLSVAEGGPSDLDATTGAYSGLLAGLNQGAESNANRFLFRLPLTGLAPAALAALLAPGARLTATATVASGSGSATSEFSSSTPVVLSQPLPVQLTAFIAKEAGRDAHLRWNTAQELNNRYFVVERSFDGTSFSPVGTVPGQGTTAVPHAYALTDTAVATKAPNRLVYYRLRLVDDLSQASYGPVQLVRFAAPEPLLSIWPNPTSGAATLDLSRLPAGSCHVQVLDAVGRNCYDAVAPAGTLLSLSAGSWPPGVYLVRVQDTAGTRSMRLLKQ